eukprot:5019865-Amphidinium_carterae.1
MHVTIHSLQHSFIVVRGFGEPRSSVSVSFERVIVLLIETAQLYLLDESSQRAHAIGKDSVCLTKDYTLIASAGSGLASHDSHTQTHKIEVSCDASTVSVEQIASFETSDSPPSIQAWITAPTQIYLFPKDHRLSHKPSGRRRRQERRATRWCHPSSIAEHNQGQKGGILNSSLICKPKWGSREGLLRNAVAVSGAGFGACNLTLGHCSAWAQ